MQFILAKDAKETFADINPQEEEEEEDDNLRGRIIYIFQSLTKFYPREVVPPFMQQYNYMMQSSSPEQIEAALTVLSFLRYHSVNTEELSKSLVEIFRNLTSLADHQNTFIATSAIDIFGYFATFICGPINKDDDVSGFYEPDKKYELEFRRQVQRYKDYQLLQQTISFLIAKIQSSKKAVFPFIVITSAFYLTFLLR